MTSVSDLADEIGVSNTAVFQHINKNKAKLKGHVKLIKNKKYVDKYAMDFLLNSFNLNRSNLHKNYQKSALFMLKDELYKKDKQIDNLNTELKQEQTLHLNTQKELQSVKHELKLANSSSSNKKESNDSHGSLYKFFHNFF